MIRSNPLTAASDIQRAIKYSPRQDNTKLISVFGPYLGEFADDVLKISDLGREKLQTEAQLEQSKEIQQIANDVVRVNSSIGKARSSGNLTSSQATSLYNKIAALL
ncbi:hypothetical protein [Colwellia piezophila]|uniref:hypothetical protein n=1 Tax=Colwellia piezophila TaxID=211668 RepID=UPI0003734C29|nr:hypothetical protein [Colwellia piezophila]